MLTECKPMQKEEKGHTQSASAGIPRTLKESFEVRSGLSFDDVVIHYRSDRPGRLGALAYTQGRHVYIGPGQEKSLPHELVHVAQQKQGLVRPTFWQGGRSVNDQPALERAAQQGAVERRAAAGEYFSDETMPLQFDRTPTFYTYLLTPSGNTLSSARQGPHTIPHCYYEFLVQNYDLNKIFESMVPRPEEIEWLVDREEVRFDRNWAEQQIQHAHNGGLNEYQLWERANNWEEDFPRRLTRFLDDYREIYDSFQEAKNNEDLMSLLNMHPYATYAWRGNRPNNEEIQGKGESELMNMLQASLQQHKDLAFAVPSMWKKHVDLGAEERRPFHLKEAFQSFLEQRLWYGVRTNRQLRVLAAQIADRLDEEELVLN